MKLRDKRRKEKMLKKQQKKRKSSLENPDLSMIRYLK